MSNVVPVPAQSGRIRTIVSADGNFEQRLKELTGYLAASNYPKHVIDEQLNKVRAIPRKSSSSEPDQLAKQQTARP